jgi:hypothetical protein
MTTDSPERIAAEELRLHLGELTPREVEVARAAITYACRPDRSPAGEVRVKARKLLDELAYECLQTGDMLSDGVQKAYGDLEDELLKPAALSPAPAPELHHYSGCATHNAPAYEPGPCDCGGYLPAPEREGLVEALRWYADEENWKGRGREEPCETHRVFSFQSGPARRDGGRVARAALAAYEEKQNAHS